jgi:hypothetical protein
MNAVNYHRVNACAACVHEGRWRRDGVMVLAKSLNKTEGRPLVNISVY